MSQSELQVDTRTAVQVFDDDKFRMDVHYELRSATKVEEWHGVVDVRILLEGESGLTLEQVRAKAAGSTKNLLSMLVSHLQSNP